MKRNCYAMRRAAPDGVVHTFMIRDAQTTDPIAETFCRWVANKDVPFNGYNARNMADQIWQLNCQAHNKGNHNFLPDQSKP